MCRCSSLIAGTYRLIYCYPSEAYSRLHYTLCWLNIAVQVSQAWCRNCYQSYPNKRWCSEVLYTDENDTNNGNGCWKPIQGKSYSRFLSSVFGTGLSYRLDMLYIMQCFCLKLMFLKHLFQFVIVVHTKNICQQRSLCLILIWQACQVLLVNKEVNKALNTLVLVHVNLTLYDTSVQMYLLVYISHCSNCYLLVSAYGG